MTFISKCPTVPKPIQRDSGTVGEQPENSKWKNAKIKVVSTPKNCIFSLELNRILHGFWLVASHVFVALKRLVLQTLGQTGKGRKAKKQTQLTELRQGFARG